MPKQKRTAYVPPDNIVVNLAFGGRKYHGSFYADLPGNKQITQVYQEVITSFEPVDYDTIAAQLAHVADLEDHEFHLATHDLFIVAKDTEVCGPNKTSPVLHKCIPLHTNFVQTTPKHFTVVAINRSEKDIFRGVVSGEGTDSESFLHTAITNEVNTITADIVAKRAKRRYIEHLQFHGDRAQKKLAIQRLVQKASVAIRRDIEKGVRFRRVSDATARIQDELAALNDDLPDNIVLIDGNRRKKSKPDDAVDCCDDDDDEIY